MRYIVGILIVLVCFCPVGLGSASAQIVLVSEPAPAGSAEGPTPSAKQKYYCDGSVRCVPDAGGERWIPDCREREAGKWQCKMHKGPKCDLGEN